MKAGRARWFVVGGGVLALVVTVCFRARDFQGRVAGSVEKRLAGDSSGSGTASTREGAAAGPVWGGQVECNAPYSRMLQPTDEPDWVGRVADVSQKLEDRIGAIQSLARRGDSEAAQMLMKVGDAGVYLSAVAVEELGLVSQPGVREYLRSKLDSADYRLVVAAVRALSRQAGVGSVSLLAEAIQANRERADGYHEVIWTECVRAMGAMRSPVAVPVLVAELGRVGESGGWVEYGSEVVAALRTIGEPSAVAGLQRYAAALEARLQGMGDNPLGQDYLRRKLAQVREAIEFLSMR